MMEPNVSKPMVVDGIQIDDPKFFSELLDDVEAEIGIGDPGKEEYFENWMHYRADDPVAVSSNVIGVKIAERELVKKYYVFDVIVPIGDLRYHSASEAAPIIAARLYRAYMELKEVSRR